MNLVFRFFVKPCDEQLKILVSGTAGLAIIMFVFAAIWFIDPALLTLVLRFRQARCTTKNQAFLVGISNCSWTSCRLGCTREIYKCWQIQVGTKTMKVDLFWSDNTVYIFRVVILRSHTFGNPIFHKGLQN